MTQGTSGLGGIGEAARFHCKLSAAGAERCGGSFFGIYS